MRIEARTKILEEGDTVVDEEVDIEDVSEEAVGEAVALVVEGVGDKAGLGEVDGSELEEPARLAGVVVHGDEGSNDGFMLM